MLLNVVWFVIGLLALYAGAEALVRGAVRLSVRMGVSPLVVGLTVVAFGSSAPELLVGVVASLRHQSDVVLGNVVGSNVINIGLILGVSALVRPLRVGLRLMRREAPVMVGASVLVTMLMMDRTLGRIDGVILLGLFVAFLQYVQRESARESREVEAEYLQYGGHRAAPSTTTLRDAAMVVFGLAGLVLGAHLLVGSAVYFARLLGVSEILVGLTVVAMGTSLPELATCVVAARRNEPDIALGNAVGSNIFNLLSILGVSSLLRPIPVAAGVLEFDAPAMIFFALILVPLALKGKVLGRISGSVLVTAYVAFTAFLVLRAIPS